MLKVCYSLLRARKRRERDERRGTETGRKTELPFSVSGLSRGWLGLMRISETSIQVSHTQQELSYHHSFSGSVLQESGFRIQRCALNLGPLRPRYINSQLNAYFPFILYFMSSSVDYKELSRPMQLSLILTLSSSLLRNILRTPDTKCYWVRFCLSSLFFFN